MMHRDMVSVFVGLGANLGNAQGAVMQAVESIGKLPNTQLIRCSSLYRSAPVDATGPDYINAVLHIESRINAYDLLNAFQDILFEPICSYYKIKTLKLLVTVSLCKSSKLSNL